jgi:hypothetical protein
MERHLAEELFKLIPTIKEYTFTEGRVCYDTIITLNNDKKILGEIKVRSFQINKYPDYILEGSKLISLINRKKKDGFDLIYYINFFTNKDKLYDFIVFDLTARIKTWKINKPIITKMWMNAETHLSTTIKVPKEVILLKYDPEMDCKGILPLN